MYGIVDDLLRRLRSVQNAAARLVAGSRRSDHSTPVMRRLHWLPVRRHIEFQLALLIYKSLNGSTPRYLSYDCQLVSDVGFAHLMSPPVWPPRTHTGFGDSGVGVRSGAVPELASSAPPLASPPPPPAHSAPPSHLPAPLPVSPLPSLFFPSLLHFHFPCLSSLPVPSPPLEEGSPGVLPGKFSNSSWHADGVCKCVCF